MKKRLEWVGGVAWGALAALMPLSAFADTPPAQIDVKDIPEVIGLIEKLGSRMFELLIAISIIMILVAAYKYLTAGSDAEKVTSAHKTITWAAVAIVVALLAKGFPAIVRSIFSDSGNRAAVAANPAAQPPSAQFPNGRIDATVPFDPASPPGRSGEAD